MPNTRGLRTDCVFLQCHMDAYLMIFSQDGLQRTSGYLRVTEYFRVLTSDSQPWKLGTEDSAVLLKWEKLIARDRVTLGRYSSTRFAH